MYTFKKKQTFFCHLLHTTWSKKKRKRKLSISQHILC